MRNIALIIATCLCLMLLGGCPARDKERSYSVVVHNTAHHDVMLAKVTVNSKDYLNTATVLKAASANTAGGEYWAAFMSGRTVKILVVIEDSLAGGEFGFEHELTDNEGQGYVIMVDYAGDGKAEFSTNTVGKLSVWGSK